MLWSRARETTWKRLYPCMIKESKDSIDKITEGVNEALEDMEEKYKDDLNKLIESQKKSESDLDGKIRADLDNAIKESKEGDHNLVIMINDLREKYTAADQQIFDNIKEDLAKVMAQMREGLDDVSERQRDDIKKVNDSTSNELNLLLVKIGAVQDHSDNVKADTEKLADVLEDLQEKNTEASQNLRDELASFTSNIQLTIKADQETNLHHLEKSIEVIRAELKELADELNRKTNELKDINDVQNEDIDGANGRIGDIQQQILTIGDRLTELNVINLKIEGIQKAETELDDKIKSDLEKIIKDSKEADNDMHKLIETLRDNLLTANNELLAKITNVHNDVQVKVDAVDSENKDQNDKINALEQGQRDHLEKIVSLHETTVVYEEKAKVVEAERQQSENAAKENIQAMIKENKDSIDKITEGVNEALEDMEEKYKDDLNKLIESQKKSESDLDGKITADLDNAIKESKEGDHNLVIMINDLREKYTAADQQIFDNIKEDLAKVMAQMREGLDDVSERQRDDIKKVNDSTSNELNLLLVKIGAVQDHSDNVKADTEKLADVLEDLQEKNTEASQNLRDELASFTSNIQLTIKADQETNLHHLEKSIEVIRAELKELADELNRKTNELKDINDVQNEDIDGANGRIGDIQQQILTIGDRLTELNVINLKIEGIQKAKTELDDKIKSDL